MLTMKKNSRKNEVEKICFILLTICIIYSANTIAQPTLGFNKILSGLTSPVDIKNAGDGSKRIFIVEQSGTVRIYKNGNLLNKPFLNISNLTKYKGTEKGLLSIAFHPKYQNNRYFFIYYNNLDGNITLARYRVSKTNPDSADPSSGVILFSRPKPGGFGNHNGGTLQFGKDGYLYLSIGDGGGEGDPYRNGQNGQTFYAKMLRFDIDVPNKPYYAIPPDNPFVRDPNVLDEIYDLGLRNPWKWSFDRQTGDMWIGDVGQDSIEEIDFRKPHDAGGANFGWSCYEGKLAFNSDSCKKRSSYVFPIFQYHHDINTGGECVIGGYVYRGSKYPQLQGYYICADYVKNNVWKIKPNTSGGWNIYLQQGAPASLISFGEDEAGELYASTRSGNVYHVIATTAFVESAPGVSNNSSATFIYPTLVDNNSITVILNDHYSYARVVDMSGKQVLKKDITNATGKVSLHLPKLAAGTYIVQLLGNKTIGQKIYIAR
jgi:glucose/arabinose dehydrogenase